MTGIHHTINHIQKVRTVLGNQRIHRVIQQGIVCHAKLNHSICVGDTLRSATGNNLTEEGE